MKDYPTEEQLKEIESFDLANDSIDVLLYLIEDLWNWPDRGFKKDGDYLELHTGGWSGNEDIINALSKNFIFWSQYWVCTWEGGHYYFYFGPWYDCDYSMNKP